MKYPILNRLPRLLFQGPIYTISFLIIFNCIYKAETWLCSGIHTQLSQGTLYYAGAVVFASVVGGFLADYILSAFEDTVESVREALDAELE